MSNITMGSPNIVNLPSIGWRVEASAFVMIATALVCVIARMYMICRTHGWED